MPAKKWMALGFKLAVTAGLVYTLYRQVYASEGASYLAAELTSGLTLHDYYLLVLVSMLMPVNLLLEALKFRLLLGQDAAVSLSLRQSSQRVLAGISVGFFTPNRIGEYAGRVAGARPGERSQMVAATFVGGLAQWIPLLAGGVLAGAYWLGTQRDSPEFLTLLVLSASLIVVGFGVSYMALPYMLKQLQRIKLLRKQLEKFGKGIGSTVRSRLVVLTYAVLRYSIYLLQLSLAFIAFGLDESTTLVLAGTAILLLAQTFIPLPAVVQALARTEIAVLLWSNLEPNPLALGAASLFIFVLNLGLPALVGLGVILRTDVEQTLDLQA